jgi:hypothetical protein
VAPWLYRQQAVSPKKITSPVDICIFGGRTMGGNGTLVLVVDFLDTQPSLEVRGLASRRGTLSILLVEILVPVVRAGELSFDEKVAHLRLNFERIAGSHDEVR